VLLLAGVVAVELEVELELVDPHSACSSCRADAWSAAVQFAWRHPEAALWKALLEQTQVRSVYEVHVAGDKEFVKQLRMQADCADTPTAAEPSSRLGV